MTGGYSALAGVYNRLTRNVDYAAFADYTQNKNKCADYKSANAERLADFFKSFFCFDFCYYAFATQPT